eukprot:scaffold250916_cov47-Prasinocladus_malaysianus.AAC.1
MADYHEVFSETKLKHFESISETSGIPCTDMLFFDDESRNSNVKELGVTFVQSSGGLTVEMMKDGLKRFQENKKSS